MHEQSIDGKVLTLRQGFTCPVVGSYKAGVTESVKAQDGYDKATKGGNEIISKDEFSGADTAGNDMVIKFDIKCSGGQRPVYYITQIIS
jgi:hypothetical protein